MEAIIISESDQKPRQYEENAYADMEFAKKALQNVGEAPVEFVAKMGDENQVRCHCAYPC